MQTPKRRAFLSNSFAAASTSLLALTSSSGLHANPLGVDTDGDEPDYLQPLKLHIDPSVLTWQEVSGLPVAQPIVRANIKSVISIYSVNNEDLESIPISYVRYVTDVSQPMPTQNANPSGRLKYLRKNYRYSEKVGRIWLHKDDTLVVVYLAGIRPQTPTRVLHHDMSFTLPRMQLRTKRKIPSVLTMIPVGDVISNPAEPRLLMLIRPTLLDDRH